MKSLASRLGLSLIALTALGGTLAPARAATNLLANPGFETSGGSYTGWYTFGSGVQMSTPATDNIAHSGTAASKIYGGFTGCPGSPVFNVGGCGQAFTAPVIGNTYTLTGYSYIASADSIPGTAVCTKNRLIAKVVFFNALSGGSELNSNEVVLGSALTPKDQWIPFTVSAIAPTGAQRVEVDLLFLQPGCDGGSVFTDDLSFTTAGTSPVTNLLTNPNFSSGLTGWSTFGNVYTDARSWAGRTPGAAKMFSTFVFGSPSGMYQRFAGVAGKPYRFGAWVLNTCQDSPIEAPIDNYVTAKIVYRDAANNELGNNEVTIADATSPLGTYTWHEVSGTSPAGTAWVEPYLLFNSPSLYGGAIFFDDAVFQRVDLVGVETPGSVRGLTLAVAGAVPLRDAVRFDYALPRAGHASLAIFDLTGRQVATLTEGAATAGSHVASWNGRVANGAVAPNGIYQAVLRTEDGRATARIVVAH